MEGRSLPEALEATDELTVREPTTGEVYRVVGFRDELLPGFVETLTAGSEVRLELAPAGEGEKTREVTRMFPTTVMRSLGS